MTVLVTVRTMRRVAPDAPVSVSHNTIEIENSSIERCLRAGGFNEDGTFEFQDVASVSLKSALGTEK